MLFSCMSLYFDGKFLVKVHFYKKILENSSVTKSCNDCLVDLPQNQRDNPCKFFVSDVFSCMFFIKDGL